ncbi:MAG: DUF4038 domain-containing protein [Acidobacteria bacterium]|nr:DUF4038 domain-containing protein [Acidobacteriota bacterium]
MKNRGRGSSVLHATNIVICLVALVASLKVGLATGSARPPATPERMVEWTIESRKAYADPFNDVDVDVIFSKDGASWRVPTFWRGGSEWTVRFAPPSPGEYSYHLESTDASNPDLNGHEGRVTITAYTGTNALLRHGPPRVSSNKRYFEHADGTPLYWLGDTWWTGLSDRLPWEGFQRLTADRKAKGFTVIQIVAGLIPSNEELAPSDPGFCNEGGCVWEPEFKRINPQYFDYADRRIQHLLDNGLTPAIVGGWHQVLAQMGVAKMKKHWRYVIARYGGYPVFWIVGGEINDPPPSDKPAYPWMVHAQDIPGGWTEVARYIRASDPYRHPLTAHEGITPDPLQDSSLIDFDLTQPSHSGWYSIALGVAQMTTRYARAMKPVVMGEIDYEQLGGWNLQDTQRVAFWLSMLNGAAGHTYGAVGTWEAYSADKPFQRAKLSILTWEEGMILPGSYQIGLGAKLLRQYPWHRFTPHPEWVVPRGTTLFDPNAEIPHIGRDFFDPYRSALAKSPLPSESEVPAGEWKKRNGTFRLPYAAGIPGEVRFIYAPYFGLASPDPPTVLHLEPGILYGAYFWDPSLGIKVDLGTVQRPEPGRVIFQDSARDRQVSTWVTQTRDHSTISLVKKLSEANLVAAVDIKADADVALILRYQDPDNYISAAYSRSEQAIFLRRRSKGEEGPPIGQTAAPVVGANVRLSTELRDGFGIVSITDGQHTFTSPIVSLGLPSDPPPGAATGGVGVMHRGDFKTAFGNFEVRGSPALVKDELLERKLYDARGVYRGEMSGSPEWEAFGRTKLILLDAYRPERFPYAPDWVLVLERRK